MKTITIKKLYRNHVSIRDYIVEKAITKNEPIKVKYKNQIMVITSERLSTRFQLTNQSFQSQHKENTSYKLYDFLFIPNEVK